MRSSKLFLAFLIVFLFLTLSQAYATPKYHLPKNTVIRDGLKVHFGDYWVSTSGTDMTITVWFINNWMNYTVNSAGTQNIHNGTKPQSVYIDGVNRTENDGWTYSSGTVTVTDASADASLLYGAGGPPADNPPTYSNIGSNSTVNGSACLLSSYWNDDNGLSHYEVEHNNTGTLQNVTDSFSGTPSWANKTITLNSTVGVVVAWRTHGNDTINQWNTTAWQYITITSEGENWWQMTFNHLDLDSNVVDSKITWKLYNSSDLLDYTEGEYSLLDGTYTLKTYYRSNQINQTSLPTATYGNTTINIPLQMKAISTGYITFNNTITGITITSTTATRLVFTATGTETYQITIATAKNATSITKDGVPKIYGTDWLYDSGNGIVTINSTLSAWELLFASAGAGEETAWVPFLDFIWAGDYLGFIQGVYVSAFQSADLFWGMVILLFMVPLYIRTRSLLFMSILWILLGSLFLVAMPIVSGLAVLLLSLGLAGMFFKLFTRNRG